jgi:thiol-disulfide isomerase/thioredoxin
MRLSLCRIASAALSLTTLFLLSPACAQTPPAQPAYRSDPKFIGTYNEANDLVRRRMIGSAVEHYKKANKIAGGQCAECLTQAYLLQVKSGEYKDAVATAGQLETIATSPAAKATAQIDRGLALFRQAGDKGKPELLEAADAAFKAALVSDPKSGTAHFFDGRILAKLGQMAAARQQFKECLSCISPKDPSYLRAQHFAENPALSTAKFAPAFEVLALDGSRFNLDAMGGRVVLIDFWATWCGPCKEELPQVKKIAKDFAGQPFVIISVSWDSDETKWKDFINKNEMTWVQYRDADHRLSQSFGIESIPHYFTIDSDGVLTAEVLGSGNDVEGKLKKLVAKARARAAQPPPTPAAGN